MRTSKRDRFQWIMGQVERWRFVDILNSDFVDGYLEQFKPTFQPMTIGAHKCQQLRRDLSEMADFGFLKRGTIGVGGNWQPGFPKWVRCYSVGTRAATMSVVMGECPKCQSREEA